MLLCWVVDGAIAAAWGAFDLHTRGHSCSLAAGSQLWADDWSLGHQILDLIRAAGLLYQPMDTWWLQTLLLLP